MMLNRAATLLGATVLMAAALTTVEASSGEKNKDVRKTKGIFGKLMEKTHGNADGAGDANAAGDILAEDEEYWERFLQATVDSIPSASPSAPPTPGPQCDVSVSFSFFRRLIGRYNQPMPMLGLKLIALQEEAQVFFLRLCHCMLSNPATHLLHHFAFLSPT